MRRKKHHPKGQKKRRHGPSAEDRAEVASGRGSARDRAEVRRSRKR